MILEEWHRVHPEGILVDVEHVKEHRSKKEMQQMTLFERFITESNEKANELAMEGAIMDGAAKAQVRVSTVQQEREVCAALQHADSFHCLVEEWKDFDLNQSQKKVGFCEQKR